MLPVSAPDYVLSMLRLEAKNVQPALNKCMSFIREAQSNFLHNSQYLGVWMARETLLKRAVMQGMSMSLRNLAEVSHQNTRQSCTNSPCQKKVSSSAGVVGNDIN